jgi:hypothetical protein
MIEGHTMPTDEQIWKMLDTWYHLIGRLAEPSAADRERDFAAMKRSLLAFEECHPTEPSRLN